MTTVTLPQVKSPAGFVPTDIEWADFAFNPIRAVVKHDIMVKSGRAVHAATPGARLVKAGKAGWACQKVATGCKNCYAEAINKRFGTGLNYDAEAMKHVEVMLDGQRIRAALEARTRGPYKASDGRAKVFVADMTDLAGDFVTDPMLTQLFLLFTHRQDIDFLLLTKRPARIAAFLMSSWIERLTPNIWIGCSVSSQADADQNLGALFGIPAHVRYVSYEPATGDVDWSILEDLCREPDGSVHLRCEYPRRARMPAPLDWLIVGGESGHGARACNLAWLRSAVKQAKAAGVPVFVKQLGSRPWLTGAMDRKDITAWPANTCVAPARDMTGEIHGFEVVTDESKGGDPSEWPEHLRVREWPDPMRMERGKK